MSISRVNSLFVQHFSGVHKLLNECVYIEYTMLSLVLYGPLFVILYSLI